MIVEGLLDLLYGLLDLLLRPIDIPDLPQGVEDVMQTAGSYITQGLGVVAAFTHLSYLTGLFAVVIVIEVAMLLYKFVRWVLQKIPMAAVE